MKGVKDIESDRFNPYATILFTQQAKETVDSEAARIFLELAEEKRLPSWVPPCIDIKMIRAAAS